MSIKIMDTMTGDVVKVCEDWDEVDEWIKWNQENYRYEPYED